MSKISKLFAFTVALAAGSVYAHEPPAAPPKVQQSTNDLYVGVGLFSDMLNVNVETVTDLGNFMFRVGRFKNLDEGVSVNMSWRRPVDLDVNDTYNGNTTGYYVGAFAGQLATEMLGNERIQRVGAGFEMGHHWVKEYTRSEVTVGLGAMKAEKNGTQEHKMEPTIFFSFNIALGY